MTQQERDARDGAAVREMFDEIDRINDRCTNHVAWLDANKERNEARHKCWKIVRDEG